MRLWVVTCNFFTAAMLGLTSLMCARSLRADFLQSDAAGQGWVDAALHGAYMIALAGYAVKCWREGYRFQLREAEPSEKETLGAVLAAVITCVILTVLVRLRR